MSIFWKRHSRLIGADSHSIVWTEVADTAARLALSLTSNDDGKVVVQLDNDTVWLVKDYSGPTYIELTGGAGGGGTVTSVFARIGDVTATAGDYTAAEITNVAGGNLVAVTVQAAIDELDTEKAPATHTHVLSQITDSGTAAAEDIGVTVGDLPQLEDIGGGTPGLPAVDGSQLTGVAGGGSAITVTDEGGAPLTTDVVSFDFVGTGVTASSVGDDVTVTIAAGSAPIDTVFSRTGTVVAEASDYDASQVDNDSGVTGSFVDDALNTLDTDKAETTDARFPTTDEKGALAGTGTPSGSNRYVVDDDSRMTDAVTSSAVLADNTLVRGDGGSRGAQDSGITVDDSDNVTGLTSIEVDGVNINAVGIDETAAGYFFGGADHGATPSDNVFTGGTSNSSSVKGGSNYTRGGIASGTTSEGGDLNLYGGTGTSGPGGVRVGGFDTTVSASEIEMMKGFSIRESADHPNATVAGRGQLWPRTSDGAIMWTDSSDVDHDLTTSGSGTMEVEDEGTPVTGGPHDTMNFIGGGVTAADAGGGTVSITIAPGAAPVDTVFSRTGTVVAAASDYDASQIDNDSGVSGAFVDDALDQLDTDVTAAQGDATTAIADAAAAQSDATSAKTKTDYLTVTGSVDLDTMDTDVTANNAKVTYDDAATVADHVTTLANVATPITTAGAALLDDANTTEQRATLGLGSSAVEDAGVTIGDMVQLENVGGNPGMPVVDGSQLTGIDTGTQITVIDESTTLTTDLNQLTFAGSGVVATEPGADGEILVTVSGTAGAIDVSDGTTTVSGADLLTFDGTAFDVTDQGGADALVDPIFNTTAGTFAEGDHTHDTLANVATGVIIGRDTAGTGNSEELTPAEARALIDVTISDGLGSGTLSQLNNQVADATLDDESAERTPIDASVTLAKMADMATDSFLGRDTAGTGTPEILSGGDATALLDEFAKDSSTQGVVPASDNNTSKFLRADGTWVAPAGGGDLTSDGTTAQDAALFTERADHVNTPAAGTAELWVLNVAAQDLMYTNDQGDDDPVMIHDSTGEGPDGAMPVYDATAHRYTQSELLYAAGDLKILHTTTASLTMRDRVSGPTNAADKGKFWVKNGVPNEPWFTDDLGNDSQLNLTAAAATTTTPGIVELATDGEDAADVVVQGNDSRLDDPRTPTSHAYDSHSGTVPIADIAGTPTGTGDIVLESSPTIVTPTIASFASATHDHSDAAGGGTIVYGDITGTPTVPILTKSITVEDPTASENISMFFTTVAITVTQITAVILGSTSVSFDIEHGTSRATATGTGVIGTDEVADSTTTGNITTSFTDDTIPADSFVWLSTSALSGTPAELHVTVEYTED